MENWAWDKAKGLFKRVRSKFDENTKLVPASEAFIVEQHDNIQRLANVDDSNDIQSNIIDDTETSDFFEGLDNFAFHITMLLLLGIMTALNFGLSIAWIKSH